MNFKSALFSIAFSITAFAGQAQTSRGGFLLDGTLGFSSSKNTSYYRNTPTAPETKTVDISFTPTVYYFAVDRLAVGLTLPVTYHHYKYQTTKRHSFGYGIGPALRYYFPFNKWAVFPTSSYTFGHESRSESSSNSKTFKGGVGLVYFIHPNIGIEGILSYQKVDVSYHYDWFAYLQPQKEATSSINFNVGLQFYLSKRP